MSPERQIIRIVAAAVCNQQGQTLLVRKRGTQIFMQPGGKRDPGESDLAALARELVEELGCEIIESETRHLGEFQAPAANEAGAIVQASLYAVSLEGEPVAQAEIAELRWLDLDDPNPPSLAPLTELYVLPRLVASATRQVP